MAQVRIKNLYHWRCDICRNIGGIMGGTVDTDFDARTALVTHFMDKHPSTGRNPTKIEGTSWGRYIFVLVDGLRLQQELAGG